MQTMGNQHSCQFDTGKEEQTIFLSQENEVYRIPALFYKRDEKILLAFAEKRRTPDDSSTEALVMKTGKVNKDETTHEVTIEWSEQKTVIEDSGYSGYRPMNPCPLYEKTSKTLFLFFIRVKCSEQWQIKTGCNKARLCYVTTTDAGQCWSDENDLTDSLAEIKQWATFAVGPGHGLQTECERLIAPVYAYVSPSCSCCCIISHSPTPHALSLYSDDKGKTWQFGKMLQKESIECEMAEFFDDTGTRFIYCNARSKGANRIEAVSKDGGVHFSELPDGVKLVETGGGCQGSVVSFPAQSEIAPNDPSQITNKWLLFTHPSNTSKRLDLGVYLNKSPQQPGAWSKPWIIHKGCSGYSDLAYIDDGNFACLMECGKHCEHEQIALKVFTYNEVKQGIEEKYKSTALT